MAAWLAAAGYDTVHTLDLPQGNRTPDQLLVKVADRESLIIVTKDADFVDSHLLRTSPARLLLISTGNISNRDLDALLIPLIPHLVRESGSTPFSALAQTGIIIRG